MDVLVNLMRGILSQGIHISNYILVHFMNVTILFVNCTSIKLKNIPLREESWFPELVKIWPCFFLLSPLFYVPCWLSVPYPSLSRIWREGSSSGKKMKMYVTARKMCKCQGNGSWRSHLRTCHWHGIFLFSFLMNFLKEKPITWRVT